MIIGVAGPYSAETEIEQQANLNKLNEAAARLLEVGHIPIIGVNAALPIVRKASVGHSYEGIMAISMAVMEVCEGLLFLKESPGANRERDLFIAKGLPIYYSLQDVPSPYN